MTIFRMLRRILVVNRDYARTVFISQLESFRRAKWLIYLFYVMHLFILSQAYTRWISLRGADYWMPLWPVSWINNFGTSLSVDLIIVFYSAAVFLTLLWPSVRLFRFLVFSGLLLYVALINSFGKIDHAYHAWIYVAFILIFLPDRSVENMNSKRLFRHKYLTVFIGAQAIVLMIYSLAGTWKIIGALKQAIYGELSAFSVDGFSYTVAQRLIDGETQSILAPIIMNHSWVGWILFWVGAYFEFFALLILFRPALHRVWGLVLIGMHLGSILILTINFSPSVLILGLLLVSSPFHHGRANLKEIVVSLPILQVLLKIIHSKLHFQIGRGLYRAQS